MSRPKRYKTICSLPLVSEFAPVGIHSDFIVLTVDEYESIRLIDDLGLSQQECAEHMQVARTTAQNIYHSARKKTAYALVHGMGLRIEGGCFQLCNGKETPCSSSGCKKHCPNDL